MAEDKELLRFQKACEEAQKYRPNFSRNFAVIKPAIGFLNKDGVKKFYFVLWFPSEKFEDPDREYGGVLMGPKPWIVTSNGGGRGEIILWHRENLISERIWPESDVDYFDLRWDPEDFWGYWQSGEAPSSREVFNDIVDLLKQYVEYQHEAHYAIAALWIIGTYLQPFFKTYPYLYYHGEKGVGKSLDGDAVVLTLTKTGEVQPVKIGDLVDEALRIGGVVKEGSYETCYGNPLGVKVLQLNPTTLKVEWVEPKAFIRHPFKGEMLRVKTRLGREILATKDHSFIVFKDGEVSVVDGSSLKVGDVFLTVKHIPTQQARPLDWRLGYLHGVFLAEGSRNGQISSHDQSVLNILEDYMNTLCIPYTKPPSIKGKGLCLSRQAIKAFRFSDFIKSYEGKGLQYRKAGARYKTIPDFVFAANEEYRRAFIAGYIDGDGYVTKRGRGATPHIEVISKSKDIIDKFGVLLALEGIIYTTAVKRHKKYGVFYRLSIVGSGLNEFMEKVAPFMRKMEKVKRLTSILSSPPRYTLADVVKGIAGVLKNINEKRFSIYTKKGKWASQYNFRTGRMTLTHLKEAINQVEELVKRTDISYELSILHRLLQADVLTDEVVSIEEESYEGYVYDLSTPYENFVANGVVVHNTKTLNIIGLLAFNAVNSLSVTASSLFRICQGSAATLLIDETGYLRNKQRYEELRTLLYGRYKAGQYVQRTDRESGRVQHYRVFGPTALASIEGLEDVLADRVIEIIILRSLNPLILNKEVDDHDSVWQKIRNKLYRLAHRRWREFEQLSEGCASSAGSEATGDRVLSGRAAELWRPLLLLAKWVGEDVHQLVLNYAVESEKVKKESEKASSNNLILLQTLLKLVDRDDYYLIKNIRERVAEEVDEAPAWLTNEWVSRALKRFGFIERRRVGKGTQVHLTPNQVKDVAARFGIIPPPSPVAAQPAQPSQPTQPTEQQASSVEASTPTQPLTPTKVEEAQPVLV